MINDWDKLDCKLEFKADRYILERRGNKFSFSYVVGMWKKEIAKYSFTKSDDIKLFCEIIRLFTGASESEISYKTMLKNAPGYKQVWEVLK